MAHSLFPWLNPAPHIKEIDDPQLVQQTYKYWRVRIMYSMFIGYAFSYFTRKSFALAMPGIILDLHLDKAELGIMGSVFALSYGMSKFFSGIVSDRSNPRYFMAMGLILTGICNIFVGFSSSILLFALFWGLNGWFQGFGWPSCVRLLSHWYSHSERGSWWSTWTVSQNVGAFLVPWISSAILQYVGWRWAMYVPGILCILCGLFLINRLADTPQSLGLPPIEKFRNDYTNAKKVVDEEQELSTRELVIGVLRNKYIWVLALAYFCIYFVRTGISDWTILYMVESKGYSLFKASGIASLFEVGGFLGGLSVGWISDRVFKAKRGPVNTLFAVGMLAAITCIWCGPKEYFILDSILMFAIGFATFGPQVLIGVAVAELAHKKASATATGLAGWVAYIGSASAGYPLGKVIDLLGWEGFFASMVVCSALAIVLLLPLWNVTHKDAPKLSK